MEVGMRATLLAVRKGNGVPLSVIALTADLEQEDDKWIGTILELGTSTFADTLDALMNELDEAVVLQLNEVERLGFIEEYLKEHGVRRAFLPSEQENKESDRWKLITVGA